MSQSELKPCPFCGSAAERISNYDVKCTGCGAELNALPHQFPEIWNRRADPKSDTYQCAVANAAKERMRVINSHKNELVEAFVAKTGLQPEECTLCTQNDWATNTTRLWVERKGEREKAERLLEAAKRFVTASQRWDAGSFDRAVHDLAIAVERFKKHDTHVIETACPDCKGHGEYYADKDLPSPLQRIGAGMVICWKCQGTGKVKTVGSSSG